MAGKGNTERYGADLTLYNKHKKIILKNNDTCAICGQLVDKSLKYPHPLSATVDHIIPLAKGGHKTDLSNMQLAHFRCNRLKSDSFEAVSSEVQAKNKGFNDANNRDLPKTIDWTKYRSKG